MSKTILFQETFLISGIMCFHSCGSLLEDILDDCRKECVAEKIFPTDARLVIDAEPSGLGMQKVTVSIETEQNAVKLDKRFSLLPKIKNAARDVAHFQIFEPYDEENHDKFNKRNWINLLINLTAIAAVVLLSLLFSPSILLTVCFTGISFLATAFTSRDYIWLFFRNFRTKSFTNMGTTIGLGWFLFLAHTLFHVITMPLASSFSMIFMSFIMPIVLIACINGMDEIKRLIMEKAKKMQLKSIKTLFPQMSEDYECYQLPQKDLDALSKDLNKEKTSFQSELSLSCIQEHLNNNLNKQKERASLISEGMLIQVKSNECFPVDCILVQDNAVIDASLLNGESQQSKLIGQSIPAGAINLGQPVVVYAVKNSYNSTVNRLLFRSNRALDTTPSKKISKFSYIYTAIVFIGIVAAIAMPLAMSVATVSLVMQNVIGVLFSVCLCTITLAHQLPRLMEIYQLNQKGIYLRDESLIAEQIDKIHTIVFDKTGTLTTGNSIVEFSDIPLNSSLWQRIYLLEKKYGKGHPLAKAIQKYCEAKVNTQPSIKTVENYIPDIQHRGLSAEVQGKKIHIGSIDYLKGNGINCSSVYLNQSKIEQGFSAVCVAENKTYQGVIYIKHEVRKGILDFLMRAKNENKKLIMLTGDNEKAAKGFNKQLNSVFDDENIHAQQTPQNKENFMEEMFKKSENTPKGICYVGDGLNDAPCCRIVSEKGGVSCAMEESNKSAFFTDICLNGSLDYLAQHTDLKHALQHIIFQNKGILTYSALVSLGFILSFSLVGIAVSPLISLGIMSITTLLILFNSCRMEFVVNRCLDKMPSWSQKILSSNLSIGFLLLASTLLVGGVLASTFVTGGLVLPVVTFTSGIIMACSSVATLSSIGLFGLFFVLLTTASFEKYFSSTNANDEKQVEVDLNKNPSSPHTRLPLVSEAQTMRRGSQVNAESSLQPPLHSLSHEAYSP